MVFTKDEYDIFIGEGERSAIQGQGYRWTNNELHFVFAHGLSYSQKNKVRSAVTTFNNALNGCVKIM